MQSGDEKCKPKPGKEIQPFGVYVVKKFTGAQRDLAKIPNPIEAFARLICGPKIHQRLLCSPITVIFSVIGNRNRLLHLTENAVPRAALLVSFHSPCSNRS